jgi:hypothetical protein
MQNNWPRPGRAGLAAAAQGDVANMQRHDGKHACVPHGTFLIHENNFNKATLISATMRFATAFCTAAGPARQLHSRPLGINASTLGT